MTFRGKVSPTTTDGPDAMARTARSDQLTSTTQSGSVNATTSPRAVPDPAVAGCVRPLTRLSKDDHSRRLLGDPAGSVLGSVVDDDDLVTIPRERLREETAQATRERRRRVVHRYDEEMSILGRARVLGHGIPVLGTATHSSRRTALL